MVNPVNLGIVHGYKNQDPFAILLLVLSFTFISCGLQDIPYYYPPSVSDSGESQISFNVIHDLQNYDATSSIQYFLGYDVYYRAYTVAADAESAISSINAETERSGSSPSTAISKLENLGFKRFFGFDGVTYTDSRPIFGKFSINTGIYFTIYLKDSETWFFTVNGADPDILTNRKYISRYVAPGTTTVKMFHDSSSWIVGDADYAGSNSSPQSLYFVFYGIGIGLDPQTPLTTYSSYPSTLRPSGYFTYNLR